MNEKLTLRQKLDKIAELEKKIEEVAKPLYAAHHELTAEVVPEFIAKANKKGELVIEGILTVPLRLKYSDGVIFELRPNYVNKEGTFKNAVWKMLAPDVFSITRHEVLK